MNHDANKIIDTISNEWENDFVQARRKIAVLVEDNRLLEVENKLLKKKLEDKAA
ncbi:hypothetical protein [Gracilibacillus xinjiangensis]|uniref:Phage protein n=1 Tax=Gracilibacillus xinjiangensis TaxID=1193282 RepID=A0ABV8WT47_9BACI